MFFRKQCMLASGKWLDLINALKYHWYETNLLSQAILRHVVSKNFIFKKSVQGTGSVSCQQWRNLWHCSKSTHHVTLLLKKLQHVGHIRIFLWVSGSNGSTGVTYFQPWDVAICSVNTKFLDYNLHT